MSDPKPLVLITGSSGLIGRTLARRLSGRHTVIGLDFQAPPGDPGFETVRIDLTDDRSVQTALRQIGEKHGRRVASAIHLAAYYDLTGEPDPRYETVTIRGTERLLRALRDGPLEVEQFVFASTMLVHAPGPRIDEEAPIRPGWAYPQSKAEAEAIVRAERGGMRAVLLRLAGVYDERCRATFLAQQIARIYERSPLASVYPGDTSSGQAYLHLEDLCDAVERLVDRRHDLPAELPLLLGEPETPSYDALQRRIGELVRGEPVETRQIPKALAKAGVWLEDEVLDQEPFIKPFMIDQADDHYGLDVSRAERLLGWRPGHALLRELPRMVEDLKADPARWYAANKLEPAAVAAAEAHQLREPQPTLREQVATRRAYEAWLATARRRSNWAHLANIALGAWLATSPFAFGLFDAVAVEPPPPPAAGHDLPPAALRNQWLAWSDILSGLLVMAFAGLSLDRRHRWAQWANGVVGVWVLFAPLLFWTPSAAAYNNDTLVGALVIALALVVPPPPGISAEAIEDPTDTPRGWSYNPSSWVQRAPIAALALVGLLISRYLTAYQLGHVDEAWDPFFADGTRTVITSDVSKAWPVPDAGVGTVSYVLEILATLIGGRRRWRTMPWMTLLFGLLIVPLGGVSILFIIIQPVVIGTWCSLCLLQAAAMVAMIPYSLDEVLATVQFLLRSRRAGKPFWRTVIRGGSLPGDGSEEAPDLWSPFGAVAREFLGGGVTFPWTLVACAALGVWLMLTRLTLNQDGPLADSDHIVGCLVITVSVTAFAELARAVRFFNLPLGAWLVAAPFALGGAGAVATATGIGTGLALIALSLPRGRLGDGHYGGWDRAIL
jgi:nucleoside-diphosphate-sugar epimerase